MERGGLDHVVEKTDRLFERQHTLGTIFQRTLTKPLRKFEGDDFVLRAIDDDENLTLSQLTTCQGDLLRNRRHSLAF